MKIQENLYFVSERNLLTEFVKTPDGKVPHSLAVGLSWSMVRWSEDECGRYIAPPGTKWKERNVITVWKHVDSLGWFIDTEITQEFKEKIVKIKEQRKDFEQKQQYKETKEAREERKNKEEGYKKDRHECSSIVRKYAIEYGELEKLGLYWYQVLRAFNESYSKLDDVEMNEMALFLKHVKGFEFNG